MGKNKSKTRASSPPSRATRSSTTKDAPNNSEAAVPSTQPQPHPRKKRKNNQSLPVTTSFQDPFDETSDSAPPVMYTPNHSVAESIARDAHRGSSSITVDQPVKTLDTDRSSPSSSTVSIIEPTVDPSLANIDEKQPDNLTYNTSPPATNALITKSKTRPPLSNTSKNASKSSTPSGLFNISDRMRKHFRSPAINSSPSHAPSSPTPSSGLAHAQNLDPSHTQTSTTHTRELTREEKVQRIDYKTVALSPRLPAPTAPSTLPKLVESLSKNSKSVPKIVSDKLLALESEITVLREDHEAVLLRNQKLERELRDLTTKLETTQQHNEVVNEHLASLEARLTAQETRQMNTVTGADEKPKVKDESVKDNVFNTAVRKAFYKSMGVKAGDIVNLHPMQGGELFKKDSQSGDLTPRPDFTTSWSANSVIHNHLVTYIRLHAATIDANITSEGIRLRTDEQITERLGAVFKSCADKYRLYWKGKAKPEPNDSSSVEEQARTKVQLSEKDKQARSDGRRKQRKVVKLNRRKEVRPQADPSIQSPVFDFYFQTAYMSTDESDQEDSLDVNTDEEENVPVSITRKPWIRRQPLYRESMINDAGAHLDSLYAKQLGETRKAKDSKAGSVPHRVILGKPKDRSLPTPGAKTGIIPVFLVDQTWLDKHPEESGPSRVCSDFKDEEDEVEIVTETDIIGLDAMPESESLAEDKLDDDEDIDDLYA